MTFADTGMMCTLGPLAEGLSFCFIPMVSLPLLAVSALCGPWRQCLNLPLSTNKAMPRTFSGISPSCASPSKGSERRDGRTLQERGCWTFTSCCARLQFKVFPTKKLSKAVWLRFGPFFWITFYQPMHGSRPVRVSCGTG